MIGFGSDLSCITLQNIRINNLILSELMEKICRIFSVNELNEWYFGIFLDFFFLWTSHFFYILEYVWIWTEFEKVSTGSGPQNMSLVLSSLLHIPWLEQRFLCRLTVLVVTSAIMTVARIGTRSSKLAAKCSLTNIFTCAVCSCNSQRKLAKIKKQNKQAKKFQAIKTNLQAQ